jgi:hypothetical protein
MLLLVTIRLILLMIETMMTFAMVVLYLFDNYDIFMYVEVINALLVD